MYKSLKATIIFAVFLLYSPAHAYDTYTEHISVDVAVNAALSSNTAYLAAVERRKGSMYSYVSSYSSFLPSVDVGWNKSESESQGVERTSESYSASAGLNVFNGFRSYSALQIAKLSYENMMSEELTIRLTLIKDVRLAYQNVLMAEYLHQSAASLFESANIVSREAEIRQGLDIITRAELYQAIADRERAHTRLLDAEIAVSSAILELKTLTGLNIQSASQLSSFNIIPTEINELKYYVDRAMERNNTIKRDYTSVESARYNRNSTAGLFLPSVDLSASTSWNIADNNGDDYNSNSVGVRVSFNIFSGFGDAATFLSRSKELNSGRLELVNTRNEIAQMVEIAWLKVNTIASKVSSSQMYVDAAQESYNAISEMFTLGRVPLKDTVDARATLEDARAALAQAQYDAVQAYEELIVLIGGADNE